MKLVWSIPSILIGALLAVGAVGSFLQVLPPDRGFSIFLLGLILSAIALAGLGGAAAVASSTGRPWRSSAVRAAVVPLLVVLGVIVPSLARVNPQIHDITTDAADSLDFSPDVAALRSDLLGGSPPRDATLAQQREHYPDLRSLDLSLPQAQAFPLALAAAQAMPRWDVTSRDEPGGRIEAVATSGLFHFKDDVLIRVQSAPSGSRIDVRSRSRVGASDLGVNAARIRAYLERVQSSLAKPPTARR